MSPKKSSTGVKYLQLKKGKYFVYRHPAYIQEYGKEFWFPAGTTLAEAKKHAKQANDSYADLDRGMIIGDHPDSIASLIDSFERDWVPTKKYAKGTLDNLKNRLNKIRDEKGGRPARSVTVKELNDWLDQNFVNNARVKHRNTLIDIYRFGIAVGTIPSSVGNIAQMTLNRPENDRVTVPLDEEEFYRIRDNAPSWLQNAMNLCLITLQDRTAMSIAMHEHCADDHIQFVRQKTGARLAIRICDGIERILAQSRQSGIASPYIIHRRPERIYKSKGKQHWSQVLPGYISKEFSRVRDECRAYSDLDIEARPGFYSIKSLGGKLYLDAGYPKEYVRSLMGHEEVSTTEIYTDRYLPFEMVGAGLEIKF